MSDRLRALAESPDAGIPQVLAARVEQTPDSPFLRHLGDRWSYAQAWEESRRFSGFLTSNGLGGAGARTAGYLSNRPEVLWTWFGTTITGAIHASLNRGHRGPILGDMLRRSRAQLLVTECDAVPNLPPASEAGVVHLLLTDLVSESEERAAEARDLGYMPHFWNEVTGSPPGPVASPVQSDVAGLIYTSGTTGRAKGVLLPHGQFCRGASRVASSVEISDRDVFHAWLPLFHIAGQLDMTMATVIGGGSLALFPTFSRSRFWSEVEETGATIFGGFSNVLEVLWDLPEEESDHNCSLRAGVIGHIPPRIHKQFEKRFGLRLYDIYGLTEAEPIALPGPGIAAPVGSCGLPNPDFEVAILDDQDQMVAPGQQGEIAIRPRVSDVMMKGYQDDEAATLDALRNLWFHTGDIGCFDADGFLYFIDRKKHAIRRRGENVSSWELESLLITHPLVDECAAIGVPSPLGEEDIKIVVVPVAGTSLQPEDLHAWCVANMALFMVPRFIEVRRELPHTQTGKIQKGGLRSLHSCVWDALNKEEATNTPRRTNA